jgi:hypothetical protein
MKEEKTKKQMFELVNKIHFGCFNLCKDAIGVYLPVAGNVGIFCQSEEEFKAFTKIRKEITEPSNNPDQKYYRLVQPIIISAVNDIPQTIYTHLYIRKPSADSPEAGDIDFVLSDGEYFSLKQKITEGIKIKGASIYDRPGWDNIEIRNSNINALAYISTQKMAEKVRTKF